MKAMTSTHTERRINALLRSLAVTLTVAFVLGGFSAPEANASTFTVEPTQIVFSGRTTSVLLTLRNESDEPLRFELSAFSWNQSPAGEMQLTATDDIIFFPALLTLAPHESRRVRVGSATAFETREKSYRIFVEELPPSDRHSTGVRVLTKMGIPIFLRPAKEVASAALNDVGQKNGKLSFVLSNAGTVHLLPSAIHVRGLAGSVTAFDSELNGWYLLAGGRREFELGFPQSDCASITSVMVDVQFEAESLQQGLQTPNGVCSR